MRKITTESVEYYCARTLHRVKKSLECHNSITYSVLFLRISCLVKAIISMKSEKIENRNLNVFSLENHSVVSI